MQGFLTVDLPSFRPKNEERARGIQTVLESVYDNYLGGLNLRLGAPVNVAWWPKARPPRVLFDCRPYQIRINATGNSWPQYAYQFAHELCHVITNFDQVKKHKYKWFEESLCEMASLYVLYRMAEDWCPNPPSDINGSLWFARDFAQYAREVQNGFCVPPREELPGWLESNIHSMGKEDTLRDLNGIVAVSLLKFFQNDPSLWLDCTRLNHWDAHSNSSFREYLDSWEACLERDLTMSSRTPTIMRMLFLKVE